MLKIHGLKKKFGNFQALNGLDMEIEEGALYGFVGPNGAGKSTFIKLLLGEVPVDSGSWDIGTTVRFGYYAQTGLKFEDGKKGYGLEKPNIAK